MFGKKKSAAGYDPAVSRPVLKCSICTGEQVAGFQELATGKVEEVMLIRTPRDLEAFRAAYGLAPGCPIEKIY
ncbi:MAG: aspartate dehydrogenase [Faecalibacterium sp.]